jgi:type I restriction enzyme S subunit
MDFTPLERQTYGLRPGDILITEASGSPAQVGKAALWRGEIPECCYQNHLIRFRPHAVTPKFALLMIQHYSSSGTFGRLARGVGILHLGVSRLAQLPVRLPPVAEQHRITEEFDRRHRELVGAGEALHSALGRLRDQEREILAAAANGDLIPGNDAEAPASPQYEGLYPIPSNWRWVRVEEAGELTLGKKREPSSHQGAYMRPYLRVANVYEDRIDLSDVKEMNFPPEEYEKFVLAPNDILLNEGQSPELVGRPAMYEGEPPGVCFQMTLLRFRACPNVDPNFALLVFRHYLHAEIFKRASRWSTNIAHLSRKRLADLPFPLPPLADQVRLAAEARRRLDDSADQRAAVETSLARIPSLFAELLAAATSGQLADQQDADESADVLLQRLGPLPSDGALRKLDQDAQKSEERPMPQTERRDRGTDTPSPVVDRLTATLQTAGGPMSLPELFARSGYDRDSITEIEEFYPTLRRAIGVSIRRSGEAQENAMLEAIADAPQ